MRIVHTRALCVAVLSLCLLTQGLIGHTRGNTPHVLRKNPVGKRSAGTVTLQQRSLIVPRAPAALVSVCLHIAVALGLGSALPALADMDARQKVVADVWRVTDRLFYDRTFNGIDWFQLRQDYVYKQYDSDEQLYDSIKQMIASLGDKYTRYLPPAQYESIVSAVSGGVSGIGVTLRMESSGQTLVASVQPGSPADNAGILKDDVIIEAAGQITKGLTPDDVAVLLRGKADTHVGIVIRRGNDKQELVLTRAAIKLDDVTTKTAIVSGRKVGVLKIRSFTQQTSEDVKDALARLKRDNVEMFVLDLRDNGGGLLAGGVDTARLFLPPGKDVVFVVGKGGYVDRQRSDLSSPSSVKDTSKPASEGGDISTPMIVLVNGNTASAAEVLTSALKDNGRARVIGPDAHTFGKGVVQSVVEAKRGGVAVTIARYETPNHTDINKKGIDVDETVKCEPSDTAEVCISTQL